MRAHSSTSRERIIIFGLLLVLILVFIVSLALGSVWIPINEVVSSLTGNPAVNKTSAIVINTVRLPRSLTAILAGSALGIAGLQMQTIFRNPLADPFVLGISAGASLAVALVVLGAGGALMTVFAGNLGLGTDALITTASIIGAGLVLALVLALSARVGSPTIVLIIGLMFGYASSALVTVIVAGTSPEQLQQWVSWGFGSFSGVTLQRLRVLGALTIVGLLIAATTTKQLNVLLLGENYAHSMGLSVRRARLITMAGASILGGVITAFCGPISFLGIAVPHLCRSLLRTPDHRVLVPAVILMGGIVALIAQIVAVLPGSVGALPLNAVTAIIGAPIVISVLLRSRRGVFSG